MVQLASSRELEALSEMESAPPLREEMLEQFVTVVLVRDNTPSTGCGT